MKPAGICTVLEGMELKMGDFGHYNSNNWKIRTDRRKKKLKYWMDKGCTKWKAEKLLYRYGY